MLFQILKVGRALVLLVALLTAGCSGPDTALKLVPTIAKNFVEEQFDLSGAKEDQADKIIDDTLANFRIKESARLAKFLSQLNLEFNNLNNLSEVDRALWFQKKEFEIRQQLKDLQPYLIDAVSLTSDLISEKEWAAFNKSFTKRNDEIEKQKKVESRAVKNFERFFGKLSNEQKKIIETRLSPLSQIGQQLRLQNRRYTLAQLNNEIGEKGKKGEKEAVKKTLTNWAQSFDRYQDPDFIKFREERIKAIVALVNEIYPTLTEKQKKNFDEQINKWVNAFQKWEKK